MSFSRVLVSIVAAVGLTTTEAARTFRLAMFTSQAGSPNGETDCNLDTLDTSATYYTIGGTAGCTRLENSNDEFGLDYYSYSNSTNQGSCFKAGCDKNCNTCKIVMGPNCHTAAPTAAPTHGSGSGSGRHPPVDEVDQALSDKVISCGIEVSGRTLPNGPSYLGNDSPDSLITMQVDKSGPVHLSSCSSSFSTSMQVVNLEEGKVLSACNGCECTVELDAGEYALLVEGDTRAELTAGAFDVSMTCGMNRAKRVITPKSTTVKFNQCYTSFGSNDDATEGMYTAFFVFQQAPDTEMDHGVCSLQIPSSRDTTNSILLTWVGDDGNCDMNLAGDSTVRATVIDDDGDCDRLTDGSDLFYKINHTGSDYNVMAACPNQTCTGCGVVNTSVTDDGTCLGHKYKVYDTSHFNTCELRPAPGASTAAPHHSNKKGGSTSSSPVGAIVGSVIGALVVGGVIFFVVRRRKLSRINAYAVLQDDPAF